MVKIKPYLNNLYRTDPDRTSRRGYLRLDMNEGVPGLPISFIKRVVSRIDSELLASYPEYKILLRKIASHNNLAPNNICLANGSDAAIKYIFDAYISPKDKILITDPSFAMYSVYCNIFDARPIIIPYKDNLAFPKEKFIDRIAKDIKLAIIVNPNNPTGSILKQGEIIEIIKKAKQNNVLIIVDEAYFYYYPKTIIRAVKRFNNLIVLRTFSKLCSLAGIRLGYAAASAEIIEGLRKVKPTFDVNSLAALFVGELLDSPEIIQSLIKATNEGKNYLIKKLSQEGIKYKKSYANFVLIKCGDRVHEIMEKLSANNILVNGCFKQGFLKKYIRITVGDKQQMQLFWKSFIKIYGKL